jgi:hypothetical protein
MLVSVQLVGEATVVVKDISGFLLGTHGRFWRHPDWGWDSVGMAGKAETLQGLCKLQNNAMFAGQKRRG